MPGVDAAPPDASQAIPPPPERLPKVGNLKEKYWDALQRGIEVLQDQLDEIDEEVKSHV